MPDETKTSMKGDYQILGMLGAGGMGKVYKVRNVLSDRIEAMKILLPDLSEQKELVDRFLIEIKVLAQLHHPNIAELRTALTIDNQLVMIMEFVEGASLAKRIEQGPVPVHDSVACIDQALAALGYAHKQGVVHRDFKPANMMVMPAGVVKLMDFGIARSGASAGLTMTGTTLGSVAYMSPEQVKCEPIDARSDLYSVGVSLYEMLTGQKPFIDENNFAVMKAHIEQQPRAPIELRPDMPVALNQIILMAMAKDPAQRFQSAEAFRGALRSVAPELGPVTAEPKADTAAGAYAATMVAMPTLVPSAPARTIPVTPTPAPSSYPRTIPATVTPAPSPRPVVPQPPMPPAPVGKDHRGLYITIGALAVVVVLVLAGLFLPNWLKKANAGGGGSHVVKNVPAPKPTPPPPAPKPTPPPVVKKVVAPPPVKPPVVTPPPTPQAPAVDPAVMESLNHQMDMLDARTSAVDASLDTLKRQQQAAGYGLRGDMASAQTLMHTYMANAQAALARQDPTAAQKNMDLADAQTSKLEKFLGR
ncbi:MAG TPA: serine/threonine-protein kinase [Candidatus Acidoferrum sp.]|nr:serine/threonine-protein kinase [Candidatus Acidoferrum sp.]